MTIPCTLPRSENYLFEALAQNFADHPVHCTPVIINAESDNLPVHFINHSDRDIVVPKDTYVGAIEKVQESNRDNLSTNATPESVSQHALSQCLAHSDLLPSQSQSMHTLLEENSGVFGSSIAGLSSTPLVQYYVDTGNFKPSNNKRTALATIIGRKSQNKWKKCYPGVSLNLVLALGLAPFC